MATLLSQLSESIDFFTTGPKRETLALHLAKNDENLKDLKKNPDKAIRYKMDTERFVLG